MNHERLYKLAAAIELVATPVPGFDMTIFYQSNHAVSRNVNSLRDDAGGFSAGLEVHVITLFRDVPVSTSNVHGAATEILELDIRQAGALFRPNVPPRMITRSNAADTLRHLARTGEVIWLLPDAASTEASPIDQALLGHEKAAR